MKKIVAFMLVTVIALSLFACAAPEKAIVGSWKTQSKVLDSVTIETTYTFNEDGTGSLSNVIDIAFTYSIEGDKLSITTTTLGIENTEEYFFDLQGSKLTLTDAKNTIELEKVK